MFFARLAVAALTFGSFTQVFSAPIAVDTGIVAIDTKVVDVDHIRRGEPVNFLDAVSKMGGTAQEIEHALGAPNVDKTVVTAKLDRLSSELTAAASFLEAPATDVNMIMVDVDGVKIVAEKEVGERLKTALASVDVTLTKVASLKTITLTVTQIELLKIKVLKIESAVGEILPTVVPLIKGVVKILVAFLDNCLEKLSRTI